MLHDLRYAIRSLAGRPLLTTVAVLSLALGIGVNTAIFSVFNRLLLRELPVPSPGDIVVVASPGPRPGNLSRGDGGGRDTIFSYPLFRDLERVQTVFTAIGRPAGLPGQPVPQRSNAPAARRPRLRRLLSSAGADAGAWPPLHARRRSHARRA